MKMIYLEEYDLPVIVLNVNMFMAGLLFIFTDTLGKIVNVVAVGDAEVFGFGASLLSVLSVLLVMLMGALCVITDLWWIQRKSQDNSRWL
jgi:hypothetical protein